MFIKEKQDRKIKVRTVAVGNKQQEYITKEDDRSPTVSTEPIMMKSIVDVEENRDIAVINIHNAFI